MIRFFLVLLGCGICIGVGGLLAETVYAVHLPSFFFPTLILVVLSTGLLYRHLYSVSREYFVQLYLLTIALKILAYGAYIFIVVMKDKPGATANVMFFMVLYIVFTALEIGFLYRKIAHR